MKKILLTSSAIAMIMASPALAGKSELVDLFYKPNQNNLASITTISQNKATYTDGSNNYVEITGQIYDQAFQYGLTNYLTLGLSGSYVDFEAKDKGFGTQYELDGFTNPKIDLNYRLPIISRTIADVNFGYEIDALESDRNDDDVASGASIFDLGLRFGKRKGVFSYAVGGSLIYTAETRYTDVSGNFVNLDPTLDFNLTAEGQYKINDQFVLDAAISYTDKDNADFEINSGTASGTVSGGDETNFAVKLSYVIKPEKVVVGALFEKTEISDISNVDGMSTLLNETDRQDDEIGLFAKFQF